VFAYQVLLRRRVRSPAAQRLFAREHDDSVRPVVLYGSERIKVPYAGAFLSAWPTLK